MSTVLAQRSNAELKKLQQELSATYQSLTAAQGSNQLKLDLSRGKPGAEQLDLTYERSGQRNHCRRQL
jgi:hypothetical protein